MGAGKERGVLMSVWIEGKKKAKKEAGWKDVLVPCDVAADVAGPCVRQAQRRVSACRKWCVSPGDKLFLQNKEIIRKMTAGPASRKPRGPGLRVLPPTISLLRFPVPLPPSESKQRRCNAALCEIPALCVTIYLFPNFSFSISHLNVLIWHLGSHLHTSSPISYGPQGRRVEEQCGGWPANCQTHWHVNPKSRIVSLGAQAVTPGNHGVWQPHWGLGSTAFWEQIPAQSPPQAFPPKSHPLLPSARRM